MILLIVEDATEDKFCYDSEILRAELKDWTINIYQPEVSPSVALEGIRDEMRKTSADIVVGIGTSGMLVHQLKLQHRIMILPDFYPSMKLKDKVDEDILEAYKALEEHQFDNIPADDWNFLYGLFYRKSGIGFDENLFKQRYKYNHYYTDTYKWKDNHEQVMATLVKDMDKMSHPISRKIVYIDMDNVLVNFAKLAKELEAANTPEFQAYHDHLDDIPHFFSRLEPIKGSVEAFYALNEKYDVYMLSTAPWDNATAWSDKVEWIKSYFGPAATKRLILSHHKNLNHGDYLIDDSSKNGAAEFEGKWIRFGKAPYENWDKVLKELL